MKRENGLCADAPLHTISVHYLEPPLCCANVSIGVVGMGCVDVCEVMLEDECYYSRKHH